MLATLPLTAQEPYRVRDINTLPWQVGSDPDGLVQVGEVVFFAAENGTHGRELWKTDGTPEGTVLVRDIRPGGGSSSPGDLTAVGSLLYFSADDGRTGREVWRSDGTFQGTWRLADIHPGPETSAPGELTAMGGRLFFRARDPMRGSELWTSDGTRPGTFRVKDLAPGSDASFPRNLTVFKDRLYFIAATRGPPRDEMRSRIWFTDETARDPVRLLDAADDQLLSPDRLTAVADSLFFTSGSRQLWRSDGTRRGTGLFLGDVSSDPAFYDQMTSALGLLFFTARDDDGLHLWSSDGTRAGTRPLRLLSRIGISTHLLLITEGDAWVFFRSDLGLWRSDGSPAGTTRIATPWTDLFIPSSRLGHPPPDLLWHAGLLWFAADRGDAGWELWRSDGTAGGTYRVADLREGPFNSNPLHLVGLGTRILFGAEEGAGGGFVGSPNRELWTSDGTPEGTRLVKDLWLATRSSAIHSDSTVAFGRRIFLSADDGERGHELWVSDGTAVGTTLVRDIRPGPEGSFPEDPEPMNGRVYLAADDGRRGIELWGTDGTPSGTRLVRDIAPGPLSSRPRSLDAVGDQLFLVADDGITGREPWRSDGTAAGTWPLGDLWAGVSSSMPLPLTRFVGLGGIAYFSATEPATGFELWRSDGTPAGTELFADLAPGPDSGGGSYLTSLSGRLYFASRAAGRSTLWRSDTTPAGTRPVVPVGSGDEPNEVRGISRVGQRLFFSATRLGAPSGWEPWVSDESVAGTRQIVDLSDPPERSSDPGPFVDLDGRALFSADARPTQLFASDGTAGGTLPLTDLPNDFLNDFITAMAGDGIAVFAASTLATGHELWSTDGTRAGTGLLADLVAGERQSVPRLLAVADGRFFFTAHDTSGDEELWAYRPLQIDAARRAVVLPGPGAGPRASPLLAILDLDRRVVELRDPLGEEPPGVLSPFDSDWVPVGLGVPPASFRFPARLALLAWDRRTAEVEVRLLNPWVSGEAEGPVRFGTAFRPHVFEVVSGAGQALLVAGGRRPADWRSLVVARDLRGEARFRLVLPDGTAILRVAEIPDFSGNERPELAVLYRTAAGQAVVLVVDTARGEVLRRHRLPASLDPVSLAVVPNVTDSPASELVVLSHQCGEMVSVVRALDADSGRVLGSSRVGPGFRALGIEPAAVAFPATGPASVAVIGRAGGERLEVRVVDPLASAVSFTRFRFPATRLPQDLIVPSPAGGEMAILGWSPRDGSLQLVSVAAD